MQKWEYIKIDVEYAGFNIRVVSVFTNNQKVHTDISLPEFGNYPNDLGAEGWEMVSEGWVGGRFEYFYFKRPVK